MIETMRMELDGKLSREVAQRKRSCFGGGERLVQQCRQSPRNFAAAKTNPLPEGRYHLTGHMNLGGKSAQDTPEWTWEALRLTLRLKCDQAQRKVKQHRLVLPWLYTKYCD